MMIQCRGFWRESEYDNSLYALLVPEPDAEKRTVYPGGIQPGRYTHNAVVELLRKHKNDPEAIQFIADMMEE